MSYPKYNLKPALKQTLSNYAMYLSENMLIYQTYENRNVKYYYFIIRKKFTTQYSRLLDYIYPLYEQRSEKVMPFKYATTYKLLEVTMTPLHNIASLCI